MFNKLIIMIILLSDEISNDLFNNGHVPSSTLDAVQTCPKDAT